MKDERVIRVGRFAGLELTARPTALVALLGLWAGLSGLARRRGYTWPRAVVGGGLAVGLHIFAEMWHQFGHARMAMATEFPMSGVKFWGVLAASEYPTDEPVLPPEIHMQRAVGGPIASVILTAVTLPIALLLRPFRGLVADLFLFTAAENLLLFTLGALLPLNFSDGGTLLKYGRQRHHRLVLNKE